MATPDAPVDDIFQPGGKLRLDAVQDATAEVLREAIKYARTTRWDSVRSPHLFMGLLAAPDHGIHTWGDSLGADLPKLLEQFAELFHQDEGEDEPIISLHREFLSDNVIRLLREAYHRAADNRRRVSPIDLLISLFTTPNSIVAECFERIGVTAAKLTELAVIAEQQCATPDGRPYNRPNDTARPENPGPVAMTAGNRHHTGRTIEYGINHTKHHDPCAIAGSFAADLASRGCRCYRDLAQSNDHPQPYNPTTLGHPRPGGTRSCRNRSPRWCAGIARPATSGSERQTPYGPPV